MKILTANRLADGEAVWFSANGGWIDSIGGAEIARDKEEEARLGAVGKAGLLDNDVVDAELVEVELNDGEIVPVRLRERIRAAGPTNRTDLGKQARPGQLAEAA
jgi:hypothetical protein